MGIAMTITGETIQEFRIHFAGCVALVADGFIVGEQTTATPTANIAAVDTPPQLPANPTPVATVAAAAPTTQYAPPQTAAPIAPVSTPAANPAPLPPVPVAQTPTYTMEQLSRAGADLIQDASKLAPLQALLAQYGVQVITQLPQEHYGTFATALRGMGAKI